MDEKINYFFLAFGKMSLRCLEGLIEKKQPPKLVVTHLNYEVNKYSNTFYADIETTCRNNLIDFYRVNNLNELKDYLKKYDLGICVGYMEIIRKEIFNIPKYGIFNLHCGKLPFYRGRAPISRAIMNNDDKVIMSLHKIDEGVDSGDLYNEFEFPILDIDDVNTLYEKCEEFSPDIIIDFLNRINLN